MCLSTSYPSVDLIIRFLLVNIRGFISHHTELEARLSLLGHPEVVGVTETFLDPSVLAVSISGYKLISRLDRRDGRRCGGIALFAVTAIADRIVHTGDSDDHERSWHTLHSNLGPVLVGLWYRPPSYHECMSIKDFEKEMRFFSVGAVCTMVFGDLNVHHAEWLRHSIATQPSGVQLYGVCCRLGLSEMVRKPTRGANLLDLFLTDAISGVVCSVLPKISDHNLVLAKVNLRVTQTEPIVRTMWDFCKADWASLKRDLSSINWVDFLANLTPDEAAQKLTNIILEFGRAHIPLRQQTVRQSSHPWLNQRCFELIQEKINAEGSDEYKQKQKACTEGLLLEHSKYIQRTKEKLAALKPSAKKWWKLSNTLMLKANQTSAIPPIKTENGTWCLNAADKANAFADSFRNKFFMPEAEMNEYTAVDNVDCAMPGFFLVRERSARKVLRALREESGTGPDELATKILKKCADVLALPVSLLVRIILQFGVWPTFWKLHWIHPLHKRASRSNPKQYRGLHLTAQLSKVVERILGQMWRPFLAKTMAYGQYQFAYIPKHGYRDALCFTVCLWIWALGTKKRIGVYCSDVAGAFDRVDAQRLVLKLQAKGVHQRILKVIESWLGERTAYVCVDGVKSLPFVLRNMVFQGTVWGPDLWNTYYSDVSKAVEENDFQGTVFADDLNSFKVYDAGIGDQFIMKEAANCQRSLHKWGAANKVVFEPTKESFHIIDAQHPCGENFKMLSVTFDPKLSMHTAAVEFARVAGWRLQTLLRTQRYHDTATLISLYKSHILSYLEGATPALFHAAPRVLQIIDDIQENFLLQIEVSALDAFLSYNLAPLRLRRNIAMLGVLYKVSHGIAPAALAGLFKTYGRGALSSHGFVPAERFHSYALHDPIEPSHPVIIKRSLFGMVRVYNRLPQALVQLKTTQAFQRGLQQRAKRAATDLLDDWHLMFSS